MSRPKEEPISLLISRLLQFFESLFARFVKLFAAAVFHSTGADRHAVGLIVGFLKKVSGLALLEGRIQIDRSIHVLSPNIVIKRTVIGDFPFMNHHICRAVLDPQ